MFARRATALALVALGAVALALGVGNSATPAGRAATPREAYPTTFPAGAGKEIAERACLFCHSPMLVTQQAKDSAGWEKTLATMEKWGAPLSPAERDTLRNYLVVTMGPRAAKKP